jgi:hypothetical protein
MTYVVREQLACQREDRRNRYSRAKAPSKNHDLRVTRGNSLTGASLQKNRASAVSEVHSYPHLILRAPKHQVFRVLQKGTHSRLARRRHNDAFEDCSVTMSAAIYCTLFKK